MDPHYVHSRACGICTIDISLTAASSPETVVDGRFVLKVTDHGYAELLEAQGAPRSWLAPEGQLRSGQGAARRL